jgi:cytochrome b
MFGYTLLGLILFRLAWGFSGPRYVQFRDFVYGPFAVGRYLRSLLMRKPIHYVGHNPAGGWSIVIMLSLGLAVTLSGRLAYDPDWKVMAELHPDLAKLMLAAVGLHLLGVVVSSLMHRENLVGAMILGRKWGRLEDAIGRNAKLLGLCLLALIAAFWLLFLPAMPYAEEFCRHLGWFCPSGEDYR